MPYNSCTNSTLIPVSSGQAMYRQSLLWRNVACPEMIGSLEESEGVFKGTSLSCLYVPLTQSFWITIFFNGTISESLPKYLNYEHFQMEQYE